MSGHELAGRINLVDNPARLEVLDQVTLTGQISKDQLRYAPLIGYLAVKRDEGTYALGFYAPADSGTVLPETILPITSLGELPPHQRTIDRQGKGVGPRLYNTPEGAMAAHDWPLAIGAYLFNISPGSPGAKIWDMRQDTDFSLMGKAVRIAEHAGRILESKVRPNGLRRVTNQVHQSYGEADLVLMNQPPNAARRQRARGYRDTSKVDPAFMIVRNLYLNPSMVGRVEQDFFNLG